MDRSACRRHSLCLNLVQQTFDSIIPQRVKDRASRTDSEEEKETQEAERVHVPSVKHSCLWARSSLKTDVKERGGLTEYY